MDVFIRVGQRQGEPLFLLVSGIKRQESSIGYRVSGIGYRVSGSIYQDKDYFLILRYAFNLVM